MLTNTTDTGDNAQTNVALAATQAKSATSRSRVRANELLLERQGALPVWIRSPKSGVEFYSGCSRAKLYEWAGKRYIRSVSIREPGQIKGTRLFLLSSIFSFIEKCESEANEISQ